MYSNENKSTFKLSINLCRHAPFHFRFYLLSACNISSETFYKQIHFLQVQNKIYFLDFEKEAKQGVELHNFQVTELIIFLRKHSNRQIYGLKPVTGTFTNPLTKILTDRSPIESSVAQLRFNLPQIQIHQKHSAHIHIVFYTLNRLARSFT